jgi:hypothetical protein
MEFELRSVTVTASGVIPANIGVPDSLPAEASKLRPFVILSGEMTEALHMYGGVPPAAINVNENGVPAVAPDGGLEVIVSNVGVGVVPVIVTLALADLAGSAALVAATVTVLGLGTDVGAV